MIFFVGGCTGFFDVPAATPTFVGSTSSSSSASNFGSAGELSATLELAAVFFCFVSGAEEGFDCTVNDWTESGAALSLALTGAAGSPSGSASFTLGLLGTRAASSATSSSATMTTQVTTGA